MLSFLPHLERCNCAGYQISWLNQRVESDSARAFASTVSVDNKNIRVAHHRKKVNLATLHTTFLAMQYVLEGMLVYPNKMDFPIMENFGVTPPPLGMLEITIERAEGLPNSDFLSKSDPYCEVHRAEPLCILYKPATYDTGKAPDAWVAD